MNRFKNVREAKEFVISRIVQEAQREGTPLSESERKLLYMSEVSEPEACDDFDNTFDQTAYERKIAGLIREIDLRARKESPDEWDVWWDGIQLLKRHDNYIVVMIDRAGLRPPGDFLKLWLTGFAIVSLLLVAIFLLIFVSDKYKIDLSSEEAVGFYIWTTVTCLAIAYGLTRWILGGERLDNLSDRVSKSLFRFRRARRS